MKFDDWINDNLSECFSYETTKGLNRYFEINVTHVVLTYKSTQIQRYSFKHTNVRRSLFRKCEQAWIWMLHCAKIREARKILPSGKHWFTAVVSNSYMKIGHRKQCKSSFTRYGLLTDSILRYRWWPKAAFAQFVYFCHSSSSQTYSIMYESTDLLWCVQTIIFMLRPIG